jgi:hypothetical protein
MTKPPYPSFNEYQAALQSPALCFSSPDLKAGQVETDLWGLPRVRSGGFALTYRLASKGRSLAVRCFHRHVPDRSLRYAAISQYLSAAPSDIFIPVRFVPNGVRVRESWYPLTYMNWVEGETLEACLVRSAGDHTALLRLSAEFLRLVGELERLQVAHGDLSHLNILVSGGKMVLVDYDGMYVPALQGKKSCELGNVHFQHPGRSESAYNPCLDRFSEIVIYLALAALAANPRLLDKYESGEGLLFQRKDFLNPFASPLLQEIEALPGLAAPVAQFRRVCASDFSRVPRLADFLDARALDLPRREALPDPVAHTEAAPIDAAYRFRLLSKVGKRASVVGRVSEVFRGVSPEGSPHIFLNCGSWRANCFTIVLWNDALALFEATGRDPAAYLNQWVSVNGLLTAYGRRPQILVETPAELRLLASEEEARRILAGKPAPLPEAPPPAAMLPSLAARTQGSLDQTREVLDQMDRLWQKK